LYDSKLFDANVGDDLVGILVKFWYLQRLHGISNKKLGCRRETARRFLSLNILLSHKGLLKVIRNDIVE